MPKKTKKAKPASPKETKPRAHRKPRAKKIVVDQPQVVESQAVVEPILKSEESTPIKTPFFRRIKYRVKKWWEDWKA